MRMDFLKKPVVDEDYFGDDTEGKAYQEAPKYANPNLPRFEDLVNQFRSLSEGKSLTPPPTALDDQGLNYIGRPVEQAPIEELQIPFRPLDQVEPDVIPEVSPGVPSDQELAMQQSQPKAPEIAPPQDEFSPTVDLQKNEQQQPVSRYEELLNRYKQMAEASADRMYNADKGDSDVGFMSAISKAGAKMNQALANRAGTTNIKVDAPELTSQYSKNLAGRLDLEQKQMTEERNILKAMQDEATQKNVDDLNVLRVKEAKDKLDPSSDMSKSVRLNLGEAYPDLKKKYGDEWEKLSAAALDDIMSVLNLKENVEARRDVAQANRDARKDAADTKIEEKRKEKSKLSDKQTTEINEFDDAINKMRYVISAVGENSNWTGPVDGRLADMLVGDDQVAFRSAVGRMSDAYRKLITGAGAGYAELAKLESRLPQPTDTYANFIAKAKDFLREVNQKKITHLTNFKKSGKDVSAYMEDNSIINAAPATYSPEIEAKIESSMKKNNASREEIINALKNAGKL